MKQNVFLGPNAQIWQFCPRPPKKENFLKNFIFGGSGPKLPYLGIWAQKYVLAHIFIKNYHLIVVEGLLEA